MSDIRHPSGPGSRRRGGSRGAFTGARYERRIVLFIDFLGFKALVRRSVDEEGLLDRILLAMDAVGRIGLPRYSSSQRVAQFSDSIVVSYRADEGSAAFWLLNQIAFCVIDLAEQGFLLRGAVTVGQLFHNECHVVGPAMVRAYEMENEDAFYPRVIVDPVLMQVARAGAVDHTPDEEEDYVTSFLTQDDDGHFFFDYVGWESVVEVTGGDDDRYPAYLAALSRILDRGLRHADVSVLRKYLWLHERYRRSINEFENASEGYRRDYPENVTAILQLPRFTALVRAARSIVERSGGDQSRRRPPGARG